MHLSGQVDVDIYVRAVDIKFRLYFCSIWASRISIEIVVLGVSFYHLTGGSDLWFGSPARMREFLATPWSEFATYHIRLDAAAITTTITTVKNTPRVAP